MNSPNKTVHAFDPHTRAYTGPVVLDESDMSPLEPGVFLLPGNCLDAEPPAPVPGKYVAEQGGAWVLLDVPQPVEQPVAEVPADAPLPMQAPPSLSALVQQHMDFAARAMGYDDLNSGISYADEEAVPKFCAEGRALRAWRSLVWQKLFELQTQIDAGELQLEAPADILPMLPVLQLPEETVPASASPTEAEQAEAAPTATTATASATTARKSRKKGG